MKAGTGYVTGCIGKNALRTFTVTYDRCSSSGWYVEINITSMRLTDLECTILSLSCPMGERISPSNFMENNIPPAISKQPFTPLPLYSILSVGHKNGRGKFWIAKYVGLLEGGARCL